MTPFRLNRYRVALVREATIPTEWDRQVRQPGDVAKLMAPLVGDLDRETFWVILLDGRNKATGLNLVAIGSLTAALCHPREIFKPAIISNAAAIIVAHQHPSGDPTPSSEDVALTKRLCEAGELLGIRLLDHIVIGEAGSYRSLADDGLMGGAR